MLPFQTIQRFDAFLAALGVPFDAVVVGASALVLLQPAFAGRAVTLATLGREDLLKTKLFALSDRGTDILDCVALAPSSAELDEALPWVSAQDGNPLWPEHVRQTFDNLRGRLGHGV
jgi:hypothetical protein